MAPGTTPNVPQVEEGDELPIEVVFPKPLRVAIRNPQVFSVFGKADTIGRGNVGPHVEILPVFIKNLIPGVAAIRNVHAALRVEDDAMCPLQLAGTVPFLAKGLRLRLRALRR